MVHRQTMILALVSALLAMPPSAMAGTPLSCEDVNGDQRADVCDVQRVATAMLAHTAQDGEADVNGDGRVDVLDYQAVVARAAEPEAPLPTSQRPSSDLGQAVPTLIHRQPTAVRTSPRPITMAAQADDDSPFASVADPARLVHLPRTTRYIRGISCHSPPA